MSEVNEQLIKTPGPLGDNFMLERELGRGGMGGVYLGRDIMLDRPVAVKVMQKQYGEDADFLMKFKKEAQAAAKLIHPNIAQIYSYGVVDNMPYIAMELVAGGSLQQLMNNAPEGKTDITRVLKICEQVAQALRCAADQGLVHGDIKPDNILLDANGNAKIVDFGLAGMQKDTAEIWGTPYYIAPEKLKKEQVDYRADMYNLGGTLYHALTGVAPFEGPDANAVVRKRFEGLPKKPSEVRPEIPSAVDGLVMKMLEVDKKDRYPTFEALLQAFQEVLSTGLTATSIKQDASSGKSKTGARKMTLRGTRRATTMKLGGTSKIGTSKINTSKVHLDGTGKMDAEALGNITGIKTGMTSMADVGEEDENANAAKKFAMSIGIGIAAIVLLAGGIAWYVVADKKSREEAKRTMIVNNISNARQAISDTRRIATKFGDDFRVFAENATAECEKATKRIAEAVPEFADRLKPELSAELLAAIALTNTPAIVEGATNGVSGATNAMQQAATATTGAMQQTVAAVPGAFQIKPFRPPTDDEADPASPEHEEYEKLKKAYMEEQMKLLKNALENPDKAAEQAKESTAKTTESEDDGPDETIPEPDSDDPVKKLEYQVKKLELSKKKSERKFKRELVLVGEDAVKDTNDLWNRAYSCQASVIKIGIAIDKVKAAADKSEGFKDNTEASMKALAELSGEVTELYNVAKGSPDVENVQKGISYIKAKGQKTLQQTSNNLFRRRAEYEREIKKIEYEIEKLQKEIAEIIARRKLVAEERETAKTKFEALLQNKNFELLEWDAAIKELEFMKSNFKTPEGAIAAEDQLKKVRSMKFVQEILVKNLKGYQFKRGKPFKLKGVNVRDVDMKEFKLSRPDGKDTKKEVNFKLNWVKFHKEFAANFNELIIRYIENGRTNCSPKLTLQEWGDAMCGAALMLRLVSTDPSAAPRGEQLAKDVAKNFPNYVKTLRMMFPDIQFENVQEEY